jgi:hypothetical protein
MPQTRKTLAVLLAALVVGSAFALGGTAAAQTTGNEPTPGNAPTPMPTPTSDGLVVTSLSAPDSAAPNGTVDVAATVENPGTAETTELVTFRVAGTVVDKQWVTVAPGDHETVSLSADTTGLEPGEYVHGVFTETDGAFASLTISESFTVDSLDAPANATSGENITATATVTNPNEVNATQQIEFRFAGGMLDEETLTLGPEESANISINVSLTGVAEGTYIHGLFTRDTGRLATISVAPGNDTAEPATVTFENQSSDGRTVVVDSVTLPEGGFVTIHDATLLEGNVVGSVIGVTGPFEPGVHENVTVPLFTVPGGPDGPELTEDGTLIAMPHLDTNANGLYEFVISDGADDGPYLDNGSAVTDSANVTVSPAEPGDENETTSPDGEAPPTDGETPPTDGETPPTDGETPPSDEGTPGEETPGNETTTPDDETPAPGEETPGEPTETPGEPTATPDDETTTPGDGTTTPDDDTTTPGEPTGTATTDGTTTPASLDVLRAVLPGLF